MHAYTATSAGKTYRIYRGDFHRHTELSWDGGGGGDGNLRDLYRYMIDVAALDFGASTDHQGGGFPYWWWYSQKMTDMYHAPGAYVPIFGYERSVGFPNSHRNVFFASRPESRVTPFFMRDRQKAYELPITAEGAESQISMGPVAANDTKLLWEEVRERGGITIPHTTGTLGGTDWRDNDRARGVVVPDVRQLLTKRLQPQRIAYYAHARKGHGGGGHHGREFQPGPAADCAGS